MLPQLLLTITQLSSSFATLDISLILTDSTRKVEFFSYHLVVGVGSALLSLF